MRLHGMVGDQVVIRPGGSGWRPPEWIVNQARRPLGKETSTQALNVQTGYQPRTFHQRKCSYPTQSNYRYDIEAGGAVPIELSRVEKPGVAQRRPSSTQRAQNTRPRYARHGRLSLGQRILALSISIFMGFSVLGIVSTSLSSKLYVLEQQLDGHASVRELTYNTLQEGLAAHGLSSAPRTRHLLEVPREDNGLAGERSGTRSSAKEVSNTTNQKKSQASQQNKTNESVSNAVKALVKVTALATRTAVLPPSHQANVILAVYSFASVLLRTAHSAPFQIPKPPVRAAAGPTIQEIQFEKLARMQQEIQAAFTDILSQQGGLPPDRRKQVENPAAMLGAQHFSQTQGRWVDSSENSPVSWAGNTQNLGRSSSMPTVTRTNMATKITYPGNNTPARQTQSTTTNPRKSDSTFYYSQTNMHARNSAPAAGLHNIPSGRLSGQGEKRDPAVSSTALQIPGFENVAQGTRHNHLLSPSNVEHNTRQDHKQRLTSNAVQSTDMEAIEMWDISEGKSICRIGRVCKLQSGTILLPQWMERHRKRLQESCGLKQLAFHLENHFRNGDHFPVRHIRKYYPKGINLEKSRIEHDLFGDVTPRDHMPHFVTDSLKPMASIQNLMGPDMPERAFSAVLPSTGGGSPSRNLRPFGKIKPIMYLYDDSLERPPTDWVPSVASMFRTIGFEFASAGKEKPESKGLAERTGTCFRSIVTNNLKQYEPIGMLDAQGQHILFAANGISREDVGRVPGLQNTPCQVVVTALTREGPRALVNLPELEHMVQMMAPQLGITALFRTIDFGANVSFEEQVRTMQTTNVLVATHGAGNANFIFMKPRATVIEVFPFAYRAGPFNSFARIFGLDYRQTMSAPQTEVFKECMNRHEKNEEIKAYVFSQWDHAVRLHAHEPGEHRLRFETEFGRPGMSDGMTTRSCVRMQELEFDVNRVASLVLESSRQQCQRVKFG